MPQPLKVAGAEPAAGKVAKGLGLAVATEADDGPLVVVATSSTDIDAVREAMGVRDIVAIVAAGLDEAHVVAAYDLGLPVAFGYCTRADLDAAIAAAPDEAGRQVAATLSSLEGAWLRAGLR